MMFLNNEKYPFVDWIINGKKTETRRVKFSSEYKLYKKYPVTATGNADVKCHIRIKNIYTQEFGDVSEDDAAKEGFSSLIAFRGAMYDIYANMSDDRLVVVYVFEVV